MWATMSIWDKSTLVICTIIAMWWFYHELIAPLEQFRRETDAKKTHRHDQV